MRARYWSYDRNEPEPYSWLSGRPLLCADCRGENLSADHRQRLWFNCPCQADFRLKLCYPCMSYHQKAHSGRLGHAGIEV